MDPINVCGRMHDLILRNRVAGYREGDLSRHLHGDATRQRPPVERTAFEHHLPGSNILAALTLEAWPHLLAAMRERSRITGSWAGKMTARQRDLAKWILVEIAARGPVCSDDIRSAYAKKGRRDACPTVFCQSKFGAQGPLTWSSSKTLLNPAACWTAETIARRC